MNSKVKSILRIKNKKTKGWWIFTGSSDASCLQQISKEKLEFTSEFWAISLFFEV